jgi:hypothetical protein
MRNFQHKEELCSRRPDFQTIKGRFGRLNLKCAQTGSSTLCGRLLKILKFCVMVIPVSSNPRSELSTFGYGYKARNVNMAASTKMTGIVTSAGIKSRMPLA